MATVEKVLLRGEKRIVLAGISWELYEHLRDHEENSRVRMVYDNGRLELMSPSPDHESLKELICEMIKVFTAELGIARRSLGSTTWRRAELAKGLEPDGCFYILNHARASPQADGITAGVNTRLEQGCPGSRAYGAAARAGGTARAGATLGSAIRKAGSARFSGG